MEDVVVRMGAEEMLALRRLSGIAVEPVDAGAIAASAMHRGLAEMLADAGLPWPPTVGGPDDPPEHSPASKPVRPWQRRDVRLSGLGVAVVVLAVLLVGGYGEGWSWTGFSGNGQLWDWLHLLLLPIALGTFPLWLQYGGYMGRTRKLVLGAVVVAFAAFVAAGYLVPFGWTGFTGNTLWDWLTLLVLPLALMTVRLWPSTARQIHRQHIVLVTVLVVAWIVTLVGGYAANWSWTGYPGNTLWDWLSLLLGPVAITTLLIPATVQWVSGDVVHIVEREEKTRQEQERQGSNLGPATGSNPSATASESPRGP